MTPISNIKVFRRIKRFLISPISLDGLDFWPSASEVVETPASPARVALMLIICALVVITLILSCIFNIDVYAVSAGRIQSIGRSKVVQPSDNGKVTEIDVHNGSHVTRGQILLRIDSTEADASRAEYARQIDELEAEIIRRRFAIGASAEIATVGNRVASIPFAAGLEQSLRFREQRELSADLNQLSAKLFLQDAKIKENETKRRSLLQVIASDTDLMRTLSDRLSMREELFEKTWETRASVLDARESLLREQQNNSEHRSQVFEIDTAIVSIRREKDAEIAQFVSDNSRLMAAAEAKRDDASQEYIKSSARAERMIIASPSSGDVQELSVTTLGQFVTGGQQLMTIVPDNALLEIEALVSNLDIGFVKVGQKAVIKVDTFPFTVYGSINGKVMRVSHDAVDAQDSREALPMSAATATGIPGTKSPAISSVPLTQNIVFPVTIMLDEQDIVIDKRRIKLSPGMTCEVEVLTGKRRLIDYLLAPLLEVRSQAIHEQ